ncbi:MAG TPA: murein biosynthesis integral membrane protein MurJ [Thermoanaerobaculia bacterium]|jgi:putative peptidoglycan lipid II flippase|nr:murein biosynthesis integral membrane protein MurJ [Thermoanaerobaculia bacterium]
MSEPEDYLDEAPATPVSPEPPRVRRSRGGAAMVFAGIFLSRIMGFLREGAFARYFGVGPHQDALTAAMRVPNVLQNLLGEGVLSASFIPIYSGLLAEGKEKEAGRFAGAIFGLMLAAATGFALLGNLLARPIVVLLASGYLGDAEKVAAGTLTVDRFALTVTGVRILFPMAGFLALSVWSLAILNSHRRFFLPYVAPVVWNSAMIAALVFGARQLAGGTQGAAAQVQLFHAACWGGFFGGLLQFLVQLPGVLRVIQGFRLSFSTRVPGVREALSAWWPAVAGRGVVQLAGYIDLFLASYLFQGAPAADRFAQMFYLLPISLFGISVAASELPELSRLRGEGAVPELLARVRRALRYVAFLNVPTVVGYLVFGYVVTGVYRHGNFGVASNWLVYLVLCGYSTGILATTTSRLLQNTFYALGDTRSPARIAAIRVGTSALVAVPLMLWLDRYPLSTLVGPLPGPALRLGSVGISLASGVGAWMELSQLRRALRRRLSDFELPWREDARVVLIALAAAVPGAVAWWLLPPLPPIPKAAMVLGAYGVSYLAIARLAGVEEVEAFVGGLRRRLRR